MTQPTYLFMVHDLIFGYLTLLPGNLLIAYANEPRCEKTGLRGFRPGLTQTALQPQRIARSLKFQI